MRKSVHAYTFAKTVVNFTDLVQKSVSDLLFKFILLLLAQIVVFFVDLVAFALAVLHELVS